MTVQIISNKITDDIRAKSWPQVLAIAILSIGSLSTGTLYSWSSPFSVAITNDKINYNINEEEASYFIICHPIGLLISTIILFKLGPILGNKKTIWLLAIPHTLSWLITIFAYSKWEFYLSRILSGVGDAMFYVAGPSYIGEISTPTVRGYCGIFPAIATNLGLFIISAIGGYLSVATTAYIFIVIPISYGILMWFLPESPYELIKCGKNDEAQNSLKWLLRKENVEVDFLNIKVDLERQLTESGTYKEFFTIQSNKRAMIAALLLRGSQQFSGIPVFSNYTQMIFRKAGGNLSAHNSSMIFIGTCAILSVICGPTVEKFGRRPIYFISILSCGLILLGMSTYFALDQYQIVNLESFKFVPITGMMMYIVFFTPGLGIIPNLMMGELFSASVKAKALCIVLIFFAITSFISSYLFTLLNSNVGLYAPFLMYGIICLISTLLSYLWLPETKGKTLEEIQQLLKKQ